MQWDLNDKAYRLGPKILHRPKLLPGVGDSVVSAYTQHLRQQFLTHLRKHLSRRSCSLSTLPLS